MTVPRDRRTTRNRSHDKNRSRLFNELAVTKLRLAKDETEATYRDKKQAGLLLRINKSGAKQWRCQFYDAALRKMRTEGLGEFRPSSPDHVSVKDARDKAGHFRSNKKSILAKRAELQSANRDTYRSVVEWYLGKYVDGQRITSDRIKVTLTKLYPQWEKRAFESITRPEVIDMLETIAKERGPRAADITLVALRRVMGKHAVRSSTNYAPPIIQGMQHIENPKLRARKRVLDDKEIRWLWQATNTLGTFGALCRMCLLTAQRRGKVANMRFDQIDDSGVWTVPRDDEREKGTGERLLLPPLAKLIIAEQEKLQTCAYVFPSSTKTGFSAFGQGKEALDEAMAALAGKTKIPHWVVHDLRRSARTLMSRAGIASRVAEKVMGHATPGVEDTYDRWGYDPERADALAKLSSLINEILQPPSKSGNVVALRR
jgi:integrase